MDHFPPRIYKSERPTLADKEPYGTLWQTSDGGHYLQISNREEYPAWYLMKNEQDALDRQQELLKIQSS